MPPGHSRGHFRFGIGPIGATILARSSCSKLPPGNLDGVAPRLAKVAMITVRLPSKICLLTFQLVKDTGGMKWA